LPPAADPGSLRQQADTAWPKAKPPAGAWLMLNGLWSVLPQRHQAVLGWSVDCHVVLADASVCSASELGRLLRAGAPAVRLLQVCLPEPGRIALEFHLA
jgi:hypothetical protein